jgi:putative transposase
MEYLRRIDELYTDNSTWGSRQMRSRLRLEYKSRHINRKRIQRLMRLMGIEAIYTKKRLSKKIWSTKSIPICSKI